MKKKYSIILFISVLGLVLFICLLCIYTGGGADLRNVRAAKASDTDAEKDKKQKKTEKQSEKSKDDNTQDNSGSDDTSSTDDTGASTQDGSSTEDSTASTEATTLAQITTQYVDQAALTALTKEYQETLKEKMDLLSSKL